MPDGTRGLSETVVTKGLVSGEESIDYIRKPRQHRNRLLMPASSSQRMALLKQNAQRNCFRNRLTVQGKITKPGKIAEEEQTILKHYSLLCFKNG